MARLGWAGREGGVEEDLAALVLRCAHPNDSLLAQGTSQDLEKSYFRLTSAPDPATVRWGWAGRCSRHRGLLACLPCQAARSARAGAAAVPVAPVASRAAWRIDALLPLRAGQSWRVPCAAAPALPSPCLRTHPAPLPDTTAPPTHARPPAGQSLCCGARWSGWWTCCATAASTTFTRWTSSRWVLFSFIFLLL